jgi:hypothetical protein
MRYFHPSGSPAEGRDDIVSAGLKAFFDGCPGTTLMRIKLFI